MTKFDHNQICTRGQDIEVGRQYQYKEGSYVADVTVLADESDQVSIGFKLKVDDPISWPGNVGDEFSCSAAKGNYAYSGMWRLYDLGEYVVLKPTNP